MNFKKLVKLPGDASHRKFFRDKKNQYLKLIPYAWDLIDYRTLNNPIFKDLNYLLSKNFDRKTRKSYEN